MCINPYTGPWPFQTSFNRFLVFLRRLIFVKHPRVKLTKKIRKKRANCSSPYKTTCDTCIVTQTKGQPVLSVFLGLKKFCANSTCIRCQRSFTNIVATKMGFPKNSNGDRMEVFFVFRFYIRSMYNIICDFHWNYVGIP